MVFLRIARRKRCLRGDARVQCCQNLTKAMEAIIIVLRFTLGDLIGEEAQRRAAFVMRQWSAVDPEFVYWNATGFYENSKGGAIALVAEFFIRS